MNPGLVRLDVTSGYAIWARCGEVVGEQRRVESRGDGKRHACTECFNAAQLPTFDQTMTLEWQPVHDTERQVLTNVETAIAFIGRAVVRVIPIRCAVVAAQPAIRICKVDAMRKSVGKVCLKTARVPYVNAHLDRVVTREAARLRKGQCTEIRIQSWVTDTHAANDFSEMLNAIGIHFDLRRVVIAERKQVHAA